MIDNGRTEENLFFAKAWMKAEMEGGEINVSDKIIVDASMVNTKAKCVYDKLLRTGIDNFNEMTSILVAFSDDNYDKSTLIYRVVPDIVNSNGVRLNGRFERNDNNYIVNLNA